MEFFLFITILAVIWLVFQVNAAKRSANEMRSQLSDLLSRIRELKWEMKELSEGMTPTPKAEAAVDVSPELEIKDAGETNGVDEFFQALDRRAAETRSSQLPPPLPVMDVEENSWEDAVAEISESPVIVEAKEPFSWEKFMGVKLFAWLGGVAMFFGVIFFVKYAFEKNLIPPSLRITMGFVTGVSLLVGGLWMNRHARYRVLAQSLCATGVLILYGVTFAAHAVYHFPAFGSVTTFVLMGLITFVAFLVAVRSNALVVAVLGMLGGFITPALLSTGEDVVFGLFGYIALLDIGLIAISRHGRWRFLTSMAALGTVLVQIGWALEFFKEGHYDVGTKTLIPMGMMLFFIAVFLSGGWFWRKGRLMEKHASGSVLGLAAVAMLFAFLMLVFEAVATRYVLLYGFILLVQLGVIAVVIARRQAGVAQVLIAVFAFIHLAFWTGGYLTAENLKGLLVVYLVFGGVHTLVPVVLGKYLPKRASALPSKVGPWVAPLLLFMMLLQVFQLTPLPMGMWVAVLILNLMSIGLAVVRGGLLSLLASLVMTMVVAAAWLLKGPASGDFLLPFLGVVTGFSLLFSVGGMWVSRSRKDAALLPVFSALLPFGMLILAMLKLPVVNPSPIFGVALLMSVLLVGLGILGKQGALVLVALLGTLAVEMVWHVCHFQAASPMLPLAWYVGFYALFLIFPFVFRKACAGQTAPWIASALSGVGHFLLVHQLIKVAYPNGMMGFVPAAFAVPALGALFVVLRSVSETDAKGRSQIAWFGGVALFFITLIFPIQFDRQWLTVSWAMEGAALLWLYRRVPHPGLRLTGLALLVISFVRLTFNQAVFLDYPRGEMAIWNWHLYTYSLVAAAQFCGARLFTGPVEHFGKISPRGVLYAFGGVLLFLLLNIEIADYFTRPGDRSIAFEFGGNFARDMTYSIAWGLFSLAMLGIGIWKESRHARYAAIGLLVVTLIKVFVHDLSAIENIFRIGALVGVAVIAFITSFLYQRYLSRSEPS